MTAHRVAALNSSASSSALARRVVLGELILFSVLRIVFLEAALMSFLCKGGMVCQPKVCMLCSRFKAPPSKASIRISMQRSLVIRSFLARSASYSLTHRPSFSVAGVDSGISARVTICCFNNFSVWAAKLTYRSCTSGSYDSMARFQK